MQVTLKLFASLVEHLPPEVRAVRRLALDLPAGTTVADVIARQQLPAALCHLVLVNGTFVSPGDRPGHSLREGDELAIWPPVAGG